MSTDRRIGPTYPAPEGAARQVSAVRDAWRALRDAGAAPQADGPVLELQPVVVEPPRLERAAPIDGQALRAVPVTGEPTVGFAAFLDGVQESRVLAYAPTGAPIVLGTVGASVRHRVDRRLVTWRDSATIVDRALYAPRAAVGAGFFDAMAAGFSVIDTLDGEATDVRHPMDFTAKALTAVQRRRESIEIHCAEQWCEAAEGPVLIDGGIAGAGRAALSPHAVGVVKSHRTLYVDDDSVALLLGLAEGERTSAFTVASPRRQPVASFYLRLRDPSGRDPLWGLVRVEISREGTDDARCDTVARWILAERSPLALPDPRWGSMSYGVRQVEQYLRALIR